MSTWRDSLLPASFRGVGFFIEKAVVPAGRKGQLHEFHSATSLISSRWANSRKFIR